MANKLRAVFNNESKQYCKKAAKHSTLSSRIPQFGILAY